MNNKVKGIVNISLLALTLVVNALGAFGFINGLTQKQVSDLYPTLITPSPMTFSIWSVIYILLIAALVMMIIQYRERYIEDILNRISYMFWVSCILNIAWIVSFSFNQIALSTLFIILFMLDLILIVIQIAKAQYERHYLVPLAFGLYAGWLMIATVVNIAALLVQIGWNGFGLSAVIWSIIILVVAIVITYIVVTFTKNAVLALPIAWAYFGIYNKLQTIEMVDSMYNVLSYVALIGAVILIGISAIELYKNKYNITPIIK